MTIDTKRGRELEKAATPGPWESGTATCCPDMGWIDGPAGKGRVCPTHEAPKRTHTIGAEDADLIVWLRNNCTALLDAAERVEAMLARVEDVTGATDAMTYEQACAALDAMTEERLATKEKLATAERRVAELEVEVRAAYDRGLLDGKGPDWKQGYMNLADGVVAMAKEKEDAERARDEALKEAHALRDLQAIVNRDGGHGSLADAIARVYAERAETDALRAQLAEALRRAEAARAILNKWCLPSLCVAGCKCAACRIRATLDPKGVK